MINLDRLSLFAVHTGPRGSGKTSRMSAHCCERLIKSYCAKRWPNDVPVYLKGRDVWSNYPVCFWWGGDQSRYGIVKDHKYIEKWGHRYVLLQSKPLNMEALIAFGDELASGDIFIDEIDLWADNEEWMSVAEKLLMKAAQQIRKKKMSLYATIQDFDWLNKRLKFQADILSECREAAFTPWGRENGLDLGEYSILNYMDYSGVVTGYKYKETGEKYPELYHGKEFWGTYNTDYVFDVLASNIKYNLKKTERDIIVGKGAVEITDKDLEVSEGMIRNQVGRNNAGGLPFEDVDDMVERRKYAKAFMR